MRAEEVAPEEWLAHARRLRDDEGCGWFGLLTAVDDPGAGVLEVVLLVGAGDGPPTRQARCRVSRDDARLPSLAPVWAGAAFAEREAGEMFGVAFEGHPDPRPLLLPAGVEAPLRRDAGLGRRAETPWPGAHEPAEAGRARRRPTRAMGSDRDEWGVSL